MGKVLFEEKKRAAGAFRTEKQMSGQVLFERRNENHLKS